MKTPLIPISWGELFDKITILQIKLENLQDKNALKNVKIEYDELFKIYENNFRADANAKRLLVDSASRAAARGSSRNPNRRP